MTLATGTWRKATPDAQTMGPRPPTKAERGFTLVEVIIAVTIMALASMVMVPAMQNIGRGELRRTGSQLAAILRKTFDDAALTGRTERVVLTMGDDKAARTVIVEATQDALSFEGRDGALSRAVEPNALDEQSESEKIALGEDVVPDTPDSQDLAAGGFDLSGAAQSFLGAAHSINHMAWRAARPTFSREGLLPLPEGIRITDVLTEGMPEPTRDGTVNITFFPNGYTQAALVHLKDADNNMVTVHLESLTGKAWVQEGYIETLAESSS